MHPRSFVYDSIPFVDNKLHNRRYNESGESMPWSQARVAICVWIYARIGRHDEPGNDIRYVDYRDIEDTAIVPRTSE
jgi:hypothetical protein